MSSHLHRQQGKRFQVELIPLDPKMFADYNYGMTINIYIYRVSQEECEILRESVP